MIVPFESQPPSLPASLQLLWLNRYAIALDALDRLKKGTENTNIHARESIRFFDRAQTAAGRQQITGVRIQGPTEKFVSWEECLAACAGTSAASDPELQNPPSYIKELLNCAVYHLNKFVAKGGVEQQKVLMVTNNELLRDWAELYGVPTIGSGDIAGLVKREETEYMEKKRHYDHAMGNFRSPASPGGGRGGRGGGGFGSSRGGRGGRGGGGFVRRDSWNADEPRSPISPNGFGGGGRGRSPRDSNPPDFILREPPRGVARGRGKLWEP